MEVCNAFVVTTVPPPITAGQVIMFLYVSIVTTHE